MRRKPLTEKQLEAIAGEVDESDKSCRVGCAIEVFFELERMRAEAGLPKLEMPRGFYKYRDGHEGMR